MRCAYTLIVIERLPMQIIAETVIGIHMQYHHWATKEMWEAVRTVDFQDKARPLGTSFGSLQGTLDHMYCVDRLWLARLNSEPNVSLRSIAAPAGGQELEREWMAVLTRLSGVVGSAEMDSTRAFVNSQGISFDMPVWQIALHVVNHGTGHRGQVNGILRQLGAVPRGTDLIQYYRIFSPSGT